jgi:acyl-CoA synthetase (AMP-forming)/AMP-acid ligase II
MNVVELLDVQTAERRRACAIIETRGSGRSITFGQLNERAAQAAALLNHYGVRPGNAVLIVHSMGIELYVALAAIFRLGAIAMFIDPSADPRIIDNCCKLQRPVAYFSGLLGQLLRLRYAALRNITLNFSTARAVPGTIAWDSAAAFKPHRDLFAASPQTGALLTFTSGSTGAPKGALRSHGVLLAQLKALRETMQLTPGDVDLTTLPIVLLANLACGVTSIISDVDLRHPARVDGARVYADAVSQHVASATASPAFFERLVGYSKKTSRTLPEMRKLFCGGAPVFPRLLDALRKTMPRTDPCAVYGSTEAEPIAHVAVSEFSPSDREAMRSGAGLLAGKPVAAVRLRIVRNQWGMPIAPLSEAELGQMSMAVRDPGEIVVSGDHVLPGYLGGRGDEETKFKVDGAVWHRTGDLGYLDERGRVWLLGRCGARIDDARGTLYPFSVECAASNVAGIERSALVSAHGKRILAVEIHGTNREPAERDLRDMLGWAHIDEIRFLKRIPVDRRHNAKVDYPALQRMLS